MPYNSLVNPMDVQLLDPPTPGSIVDCATLHIWFLCPESPCAPAPSFTAARRCRHKQKAGRVSSPSIVRPHEALPPPRARALPRNIPELRSPQAREQRGFQAGWSQRALSAMRAIEWLCCWSSSRILRYNSLCRATVDGIYALQAVDANTSTPPQSTPIHCPVLDNGYPLARRGCCFPEPNGASITIRKACLSKLQSCIVSTERWRSER